MQKIDYTNRKKEKNFNETKGTINKAPLAHLLSFDRGRCRKEKSFKAAATKEPQEGLILNMWLFFNLKDLASNLLYGMYN